MITEAIDKVTTEVNQIKGDHAQALGEYLIDTITEDSAAKIMQPDKLLSAAITKITSNAQKLKNGNCAMITSNVVFGWLNEYYGISSTDQPAAAAPATVDDQLNVSLFDLL